MTKRREFKAQMTSDFKNRWFMADALDEDVPYSKSVEWYGGDSMDNLDARISGKIVDMVEETYPDGQKCYFEKLDMNFVIFPLLFDEITS